MKFSWDKAVVCIVGLGYVGMPLAEAFVRSLNGVFRRVSLKQLRRVTDSDAVLMDVRRFFDPAEATRLGFYYCSL